MDRPWPRGGWRGRGGGGGGGWRGGPPRGGGRPYPGPPEGPPQEEEDGDRPPPGLRGRALGLWYRDRSLRSGGGRGGRGGGRKYKHCQTLSSDPERETRIRSVLERAGRRAASPPPPPPPPPTESSSPSPSAPPTRTAGATSAESRRGGPLPTFLDVYGEECEADPRLAAPIEEDGEQEDLVARTESMEDLSAEGGPLTVEQDADGTRKVKQERQQLETEGMMVKQEITESTDRTMPDKEEEMELEEADVEKSTQAFTSAKTERDPSPSAGPVKTEAAEAIADNVPPSAQQTDAPADQQTPSLAVDDVVGRLDPSLADKYRHLADSSFKQQFLANLIGNQDRDWDNLSYDPAQDGLRRVPSIDSELLEQSGRSGPLDDFRHALPAYQQRGEILELVRRNQVVVISGETGCGKTTQVVQYLLEQAAAEGRGSLCHVVCTQPRRISAVTVAERVARERGTELRGTGGGQVGYAIRLDHHQPRQQGSILFCTTGVLLQRLQTEPTLAHVSHLVIDEVHERDTLSDFLVTIVKGILPTRRDLKVILMSATINSAEFSAYFNDCPMAHIPGRAYPVEPFYLEDVLQLTGFQFFPGGGSRGGGRPRRGQRQENAEQLAEFRELIQPYLSQLACTPPHERRYDEHVLRSLSLPDSEQFEPDMFVAVVRHICLREQPQHGAILVFLSGWDEIGKVHQALKEDPTIGDGSRYLILPLHSMMPTIEQREVFERPPPGQRKIIIATNIAETSITIDDVVFVVDGGKVKMKNVDKNRNVGCMTLKPEWVSKANSRQRRGRAGRVQPGKCYHLYSRAREAALADYPVPEILRTRLEELCLQIKILRLGAVAPFLSRAMDQPSAVAVSLSLEMLRRLRALDPEEHLTPLGFHLARLPMDPQTGKMLIMAALFSCLDPVLTVASCLSFKEPFVIPLGSERQADLARQRLSEGLHSDHMTMVNAFNMWTAARDRRSFARQNFLSGSTLEMIRGMRQQFLEQLNKLQFVSGTDARRPSLNVNSENLAVVRAVISSGLYPNVIYARPSKHRTIYYTPEGRVSLHPKCVLSRAPSLPGHWLVYKLKIKSSSVTIHDCSLVSPYQLLLFGERLDLVEPEQKDQPPLIAADAFVRFKCPRQTARLIQSLRSELDAIISHRLSDPGQTDWRRPSHERDVLRLIVELVTSDDIPPAEGSPWSGAFRRQQNSGVPAAKHQRTADSEQGSWRDDLQDWRGGERDANRDGQRDANRDGQRDANRDGQRRDWWDGDRSAGGQEDRKDGNPTPRGRENWRTDERAGFRDENRTTNNRDNWRNNERGSWRDGAARDGTRTSDRPWNRWEPAGRGADWNRRQYSWRADRDRPLRDDRDRIGGERDPAGHGDRM